MHVRRLSYNVIMQQIYSYLVHYILHMHGGVYGVQSSVVDTKSACFSGNKNRFS